MMKLNMFMDIQKVYALEVSDEGYSLIEEFEVMCSRNMRSEAVEGIDSFKVIYAGSFADCYKKQQDLTVIRKYGAEPEKVLRVKPKNDYFGLMAIVVNPDNGEAELMPVEKLLAYNVKQIHDDDKCIWQPVYVSSDYDDVYNKYIYLISYDGESD